MSITVAVALLLLVAASGASLQPLGTAHSLPACWHMQPRGQQRQRKQGEKETAVQACVCADWSLANPCGAARPPFCAAGAASARSLQEFAVRACLRPACMPARCAGRCACLTSRLPRRLPPLQRLCNAPLPLQCAPGGRCGPLNEAPDQIIGSSCTCVTGEKCVTIPSSVVGYSRTTEGPGPGNWCRRLCGGNEPGCARMDCMCTHAGYGPAQYSTPGKSKLQGLAEHQRLCQNNQCPLIFDVAACAADAPCAAAQGKPVGCICPQSAPACNLHALRW